jgi:hypothetical protein
MSLKKSQCIGFPARASEAFLYAKKKSVPLHYLKNTAYFQIGYLVVPPNQEQGHNGYNLSWSLCTVQAFFTGFLLEIEMVVFFGQGDTHCHLYLYEIWRGVRFRFR